ncbi:MAG: VWA domain-containing protein [Verrucomicrobia subdivision 3 bacterium]|nr:VWA domain-containing protein [Limisphaerales bacterium]
MAAIVFEQPLALAFGLPAIVLLLGLALWWQSRSNRTAASRLAVLFSLRSLALIALALLLARPVWVARDLPEGQRRSVVVLIDRSESMSLEEGQQTRYQNCLDFARDRLLPALKSADFPVQAVLFAEDIQAADGAVLADAKPDGKRSNLGGAIARSMSGMAPAPLAVIALTDGIANERADNTRALSSLVEARAPFIGVGFGNDRGVQTIALRRVDAPQVVPPRTEFAVAAQLEISNAEDIPAFDLVLYRDGKFVQKKTVPETRGSRFWMESFRVTEPNTGAHEYSIQAIVPPQANVKAISTTGHAAVRIAEEKELRVLYVQGALTWDYKFISLAVKDDPSVKLTGLTRTSKHSVFRQNVETSGELLGGFPSTIEEISAFRVVVLSNLKPIDLSPAQQDLLARFCGELGGGVLMLGGATTFDASWQGSRLEQLLPVVFASSQGVLGLDKPFRMRLSDEALQHSVFQIADNETVQKSWSDVPPFSQYGRVDSAKAGAQVWAVHPQDEGPKGSRILMAAQRYGTGQSAVLSIQNFWRWRLAKDSDPARYDRFWRQLFRYLSESSRQDVSIHVADQDLHPQSDIRITLEQQPGPKSSTTNSKPFTVRVENPQKKISHDQKLQLAPGRPVETQFRAETAGLYNVMVNDSSGQPVANRTIEIRDVNVELQNTARDMETLRQWASVSGGLALKVEDCRDGGDIVAAIRQKVEQAQRSRQIQKPFGVNGWTLSLVLGCLSAEWLLRKRWGLR